MSKVQPFREASLQKPEDLRTRLNELVSVVNERSRSWVVLRIPDVRPPEAARGLVLANPGFPVGAIVLGGVMPTNGGDTVGDERLAWSQRADGHIVVKVTNFVGSAAGSKRTYAVSLVLFEGGAT